MRWVLAVLMVGSACATRPCHEGYIRVDYHAAYTSSGSICVSYDSRGRCTLSVPYTTHHPARCSQTWVCSQTCDDVDRDRLEKHAAHLPGLLPPVVDIHCNENGTLR